MNVMNNKVYNYQIENEIAEKLGLSKEEVHRIFNCYSDVLQEKISDAKCGEIIELAGGVGSLTVKLQKSRRYKSFKSNEDEDIFIETECKRRVKLNTYKGTKTSLKKQKVEYGIEDEDTLAYISRHKMSAKYTVKKVELAQEPITVVAASTAEKPVVQEKKKGIARLLDRLKLSHGDTSLA